MQTSRARAEDGAVNGRIQSRGVFFLSRNGNEIDLRNGEEGKRRCTYSGSSNGVVFFLPPRRRRPLRRAS